MYSPKIDDDIVKKLYVIAKQRHISMTRLVNQILGAWITDYQIEQMSHDIEKRYQLLIRA
jgi:hypothetical protein